MREAKSAPIGFYSLKSKIISLPALGVLMIFLAGCRGISSDGTTPPPPPPPADITKINHIIILAQENRGFEHYFGALREYWAANGYPDQSFDGWPQFNPTSGD